MRPLNSQIGLMWFDNHLLLHELSHSVAAPVSGQLKSSSVRAWSSMYSMGFHANIMQTCMHEPGQSVTTPIRGTADKQHRTGIIRCAWTYM